MLITGSHIGFQFTVYWWPYWILVYSVQAAILDSSLQYIGGHIGFQFTVYTGGHIGFQFTVYRWPYLILVYCVHAIIFDFSLQCTGCHIGFQFTVYRLPYWILVYMYRWPYWILVYSSVVYTVQVAILESNLQNLQVSMLRFIAFYTVQCTVQKQPCWILL